MATARSLRRTRRSVKSGPGGYIQQLERERGALLRALTEVRDGLLNGTHPMVLADIADEVIEPLTFGAPKKGGE